MKRRIAPIVCLFLLSPFIAEFLLGNLPAKLLPLMLPLGLMYGTGAIFIRELVRGSGRGWLSLLLLAAAYGLIEEGLVTQSLFNPNYMHFRLLDYGFISALGIGLPWTLYVLTIHVGWSICVPIGLVECLFPAQLHTPWLKRTGVTIAGIAFVLGSTLIAFASQKQSPYMASLPQLLSVVALTTILAVAAFTVPKRTTPTPNAAPNSAWLFAGPFVAGSALMILQLMAQKTWHWPWQAAVLCAVALQAAFIGFMYRATQGKQWTAQQQWALMTGGIAVYMWFGFVLDSFMYGPSGLIGHTAIAVVAAVLVIIAFFRTRQACLHFSRSGSTMAPGGLL